MTTIQLNEDTRGSTQSFLDFESNWPKSGETDFEVKRILWSNSKKHVIRGVHLAPHALNQWKIVTCISGSIHDVIFDFRPFSATFGEHEKVLLSAGSGKSILIPPGIGHAFQALEDESIVLYVINNGFQQVHEKVIHPLDPELGVTWINNYILSEKDAAALSLKQSSSQTELGLILDWDIR